MDNEDIRIKQLIQKIVRFNELMDEISREFNTFILTGKESASIEHRCMLVMW